MKNHIEHRYAEIKANLKINCEECSGLCCVALYCMKTDGFPANKAPGKPCQHLKRDFHCDMYPELAAKKMRGCIAYDCFGAGQKVTKKSFPGRDWQSAPTKAGDIFSVFQKVFLLHELEWYLLEALALTENEGQKAEIEALIAENEQMTAEPGEKLVSCDLEPYRVRATGLLRQLCGFMAKNSKLAEQKDFLGKDFKKANLDGEDLTMALLIAADLEGCSLNKTNFLGADLRDANIKNTNLSKALFLTQMQINAAKGNGETKLPPSLTKPAVWL